MTRPSVVTSLRAALAPWIVTHAGVWAIALITGAIVDYEPSARLDASVPHALRLLGGWDASWYMDIARNGYSDTAVGSAGYRNAAFFPLLPMLIRAVVTIGVSPFLACIIVTGLAGLLALAGVHMLSGTLLGEAAAARSLWVFALFPPAIVLVLGYSEGIAVACAAFAGVLALRGRYGAAGLVAALATLNRPTGLLVAALVAALVAVTCSGRRRVRALVAALAPAAVALIGFLMWMQHSVGDWRAPLDAQHAWHRGAGIPFAFNFQELARADELVRDVGFGVVAVVLIVALARWRPRRAWAPWWGYAAGCLVLPLASGSVYSLARFSVVAIPIVWPLQAWITRSERRRVVATAVAGVLATALVVQLAWHGP